MATCRRCGSYHGHGPFINWTGQNHADLCAFYHVFRLGHSKMQPYFGSCGRNRTWSATEWKRPIWKNGFVRTFGPSKLIWRLQNYLETWNISWPELGKVWSTVWSHEGNLHCYHHEALEFTRALLSPSVLCRHPSGDVLFMNDFRSYSNQLCTKGGVVMRNGSVR